MSGISLPKLKDHTGKPGKQKLPDGRIKYYRITGEICLPQTGMPKKMLCLQRIEFEDDKRTEVRLAYYIIGKKPKMRGKWVFGQYATFMPVNDFKALIEKVTNERWI